MGWTLVKDKITGHIYDVRTVREQHEVRKQQPGQNVQRPVRTKYATPKSPPTEQRSGSAREATNQTANEAKEATS